MSDEDQIATIFAQIDANGNGSIDNEEWTAFMTQMLKQDNHESLSENETKACHEIW